MRRNSPSYLFFILFLAAQGLSCSSDKPVLLITPPSGSYNRDLTFRVEALAEGLNVRYSFRRSEGWGPEIPYKEPLVLMALAGEERSYRLKVSAAKDGRLLEEQELSYRIDKKSPLAPEFEVVEDRTPEEISLRFIASPGDRLTYAVNKPLSEAGVAWDGTPVLLTAQDDSRREYFVQAYAQDQADNRSPVRTYRLVLAQAKPELEVLSPVAGIFANQQYLYISSRDLREIRYTLDGSDPTEKGLSYISPLLLKFTGEMRLRVLGFPKGKKREALQKEIHFQVIPEEKSSLILDQESGIYTRSLKLQVSSDPAWQVFYSLSENTPQAYDLPLAKNLALDSVPGARKTISLRLRALDKEGNWGREFRYFYLLDRKKPQTPAIVLRQSPPFNSCAVLELSSAEQASLLYTTDGSLPGPFSNLYREPFTVYAGQAKEGIVRVRAAAVSPGGVFSEAAQLAVPFDTTAPQLPQVRPLPAPTQPLNRPFSLTVKAGQDSRPIYEVSADGQEPPALSRASAAAPETLALSIPYGEERLFKLRFGSIDEAGNISTLPELLTLTLDSQPPFAPRLDPAPGATSFDQDVIVEVKCSDRVYYETSVDGTIPPDPSLSSPQLEGSLELKGVEGQVFDYTLKLLGVDQAGNMSEVFGPYRYVLDFRQPALPEAKGIKDGQFVNTREAVLEFGAQSLPIFYSFSTDGREPPDPDTSSQRAQGGRIVFRGQEDQETGFRLKLRPFSSNLTRAGEPLFLGFTIDLKAPSPPEIQGFSEGNRYNRPVTVSLRPADAQDSVYILSSASEAGLLDPVEQGEVYRNPLTFDAQPGEERAVYLRVAAIDRAGNRAAGDQYAHFTIDRKPPADPQVQLSRAKDAVTVFMRSEEGRIQYELTSDGSMPPLAGSTSQEYRSPLVLTGRANQEVTYRILARAVDELGNASPGARVCSFVVDRKLPQQPALPAWEILGEGSDQLYLVDWQVPSGHHLYYKLNGLAGAQEGYTLYEGPFSAQKGPAKLGLVFFLEDEAGNRSPESSFSLPESKAKLDKPQARGLENGAVYNRAVDLILSSPGGRVYYEVTTDGSPPPPVSESSTSAAGAIRFDAAEGETISYRLRARCFSPESRQEASDELSLLWTSDRTPPQVPVLHGVEDRGYYPDDRRFQLLTAEGKIFFTVMQAERKPVLPELSAFIPFTGEQPLTASEGECKTYWIAAYSLDEAGNRSREVPVWQVTIDKKILYVSASGDDFRDGTRSHPLKTLSRALDISRAEGRKTIYCAAGEYALDQTLVLEDSITIQGSFHPLSWERAGFEQRTLLSSGRYLSPGSPLLEISKGPAQLESLDFRDTHALCPVLLSLRSGEVKLKDIRLTLGNPAESAGVLASGVKLQVENSRFNAENNPGGSLLVVRGGEAAVSGSEFIGPAESAAFTAIRLEAVSVSRFTGVNILPGRGNKLEGIRLSGGELIMKGCKLGSGNGAENATALVADNARLTLSDCLLEGSEGGGYTAALQAEGSSLTLVKTRILAAARFGAVGLRLRRCEVSLSGCRISASPSGEFLYLAELADCKGRVWSSILVAAPSGDVVAALLSDCATDWFNNTIIGSQGKNLSAGFLLQGSDRSRFINNILSRREPGRGTAIYRISAEDPNLVIRANNISGWETLLRIERGAARRGSLAYAAGELESMNAHGGKAPGGDIDRNIGEPFAGTFLDPDGQDYRLAPGSACVDAGEDLNRPPFDGPGEDAEGQKRPAAFAGVKPAYDIGADELY